jgi:hypothetical protein
MIIQISLARHSRLKLFDDDIRLDGVGQQVNQKTSGSTIIAYDKLQSIRLKPNVSNAKLHEFILVGDSLKIDPFSSGVGTPSSMKNDLVDFSGRVEEISAPLLIRFT